MKEVRLYDSKSKRLEVLKPLVDGKVSIYCCGPTVYNHAHAGNVRPMIVFDNLRRMLKAIGYDVLFISNYTDVDDKIINEAIKENCSEKEITTKYIAAYEKLRELVNAPLPDVTPQVTVYMQKIIDFIQVLVDKGFAYAIEGDVYFRVSKVPSYGDISNRNIDDLMVGARIEENEKKENPLDFCLWKETHVGINWDSPWSKGRPGWHTECVAMINDITENNHVDIHGGGMDLKFPHHENEEAQSYAYCGHALASIWMHNGMLNINNEKMSKSLGNFILGKDLAQQYGGQVVRWVMNATHYRSPINFTDEIFASAASEINKIYTSLKQASLKLDLAGSFNDCIEEQYKDKYLTCLADDLNISGAMTILFDVVKELNMSIRVREVDFEKVSTLFNTANYMLDLIGMYKYDKKLSEEEKELYQNWQDAKTNKNFALADEIRTKLIEKGIL